jgi:hypothetical protein
VALLGSILVSDRASPEIEIRALRPLRARATR